MTAENKNSITPESFELRMQSIAEDYIERNKEIHAYMNDLMEETLISLGYEKGVEIFRNQDRWYA